MVQPELHIARPCLKNTKQKPTEQEQDWTVPSACQMPSPSALGVRWLCPTVTATAMTQAEQRQQDCVGSPSHFAMSCMLPEEGTTEQANPQHHSRLLVVQG